MNEPINYSWPISLSKLALDMGVSERALTDAARAGHLKAWRIGGSKRGELVTTSEALRAYYESQPVQPTVHVPADAKRDKVSSICEAVVAAAKAKPIRKAA